MAIIVEVKHLSSLRHRIVTLSEEEGHQTEKDRDFLLLVRLSSQQTYGHC